MPYVLSSTCDAESNHTREGNTIIVETVTSKAVSIRISRRELSGRETISAEEARNAVMHALEDVGQEPWDSMEIRLFPGKDEILILAEPAMSSLRRFRFSCFSYLLAAAVYLPKATPSDVVYIDGGYELLLKQKCDHIPNAIYEFGIALPCSDSLAAHLLEQGDVIANGNAAEILHSHFLN